MPMAEAGALLEAAGRAVGGGRRSSERRGGERPSAALIARPGSAASSGGWMEVVEDDPAADEAALERLAEACEEFSPTVGWRTATAADSARADSARGGPPYDRLLLDVTGIGPLFGGERALVDAIGSAMGRAGYRVRAALADTIGAAWAITAAWERASDLNESHRLERGERGEASRSARDHANRDHAACGRTGLERLAIVAPGDSWEVVRRLAPATLRLSTEAVETLEQLGVTSIEQLERLPRASLAARLGLELLERWDQARGAAAESIVPYRPAPRFQAELVLDEPTRDERALGECLRRLLERIEADLAVRGEGVLQLVVRLDRADGPPLLLRLDLFRPSASARHWEELVRLRWDRQRADADRARTPRRSRNNSPNTPPPKPNSSENAPSEDNSSEDSRSENNSAAELVAGGRREGRESCESSGGVESSEAAAQQAWRSAAIGRITVQATLTAPLDRRQRELFAVGPADVEREWGLLLERLTSRLGERSVLAAELRREGLPELDYTYRPWVRRRRGGGLSGGTSGAGPAGGRKSRRRSTKLGKAARSVDPSETGMSETGWPRPGAGGAAARRGARGGEAPAAPCYRPLGVEPTPRPVETVAVAPYGPPAAFCWERRWRRVERWWGPERLETGWWRGPSVRRDYYRVETATGDRWWLFRELTSGRWFLHGTFD